MRGCRGKLLLQATLVHVHGVVDSGHRLLRLRGRAQGRDGGHVFGLLLGQAPVVRPVRLQALVQHALAHANHHRGRSRVAVRTAALVVHDDLLEALVRHWVVRVRHITRPDVTHSDGRPLSLQPALGVQEPVHPRLVHLGGVGGRAAGHALLQNAEVGLRRLEDAARVAIRDEELPHALGPDVALLQHADIKGPGLIARGLEVQRDLPCHALHHTHNRPIDLRPIRTAFRGIAARLSHLVDQLDGNEVRNLLHVFVAGGHRVRC
mmetsp:Transcript_61132/g.157654  ORF Transcript_61132/g.157654 Transcript_61132/m.157654 type:complete len:264 (-) Transcript_61132:826-1617(-)